MNNKTLITAIAKEVKTRMSGESSGHDWWHVYRVWKMAERIAKKEKSTDKAVVALGALLHDIADYKFHGGDDTAGPREVEKVLKKHNVSPNTIALVQQIISEIGFKGAKVSATSSTLEGKIIQDADRLDAIGAIGIARTFAYGGHKNRVMYEPGIKPVLHKTADAYKNNKSTTINHFYEKLLLLEDLMNTKTGKKIAHARHVYMKRFLAEFFAEWDGKR